MPLNMEFLNHLKSGLTLAYPAWQFFILFLPLTAAVYQLCPKKRRPYVLLLSNLLFFLSFSGILVIFLFYTSIAAYGLGRLLAGISTDSRYKRKEKTKRKKRVLFLGILLFLLPLIGLKYMDFIGLNLVRISRLFHGSFDWKLLDLLVPVGISYYTMEAIAYLTDVYRETIPAEKDYFRLLLFLSFFPKLMEGPISRYGEISASLGEGRPVTAEQLARGYQRILWGLFKKLLIADHLAPAVDILFQGNILDGSLTLAAAVLFTLQEYADFSGTIDIVIGSARIFGVTLTENFRQPFFAKNVSDFWRRWHITLGTWFRDYIFYPVSVAKPVMKFVKKAKKRLGNGISKFIAPVLALFFVWLANGLWHGPRWTYIFYGMYFFVWITLENILTEPFIAGIKKIGLSEEAPVVRIFRFVKLFLIVITGEFFFRADSLSMGWRMYLQLFTNFHLHVLTDNLGLLGMDVWDYWTAGAGLLVLLLVDILKEMNVPIRRILENRPKPVRYAFWYACILTVVIFAAYGTGYDAAGMIYAKF